MDDFTYSLVLPPQYLLPSNVIEAYAVICEGILAAVKRLGLQAVMQARDSGDYSQVKGACFAASTQADLEYNGRKICGSAQVRRHGAVLQHGSILLQDHSRLLYQLLRFDHESRRRRALQRYRSRCAPLCDCGIGPSWENLAECFIDGFSECFNAHLEKGILTPEEEARWRVNRGVYGSSDWLMQVRE
jgi:lipoate-protein ligase A